jgi:putative phosphoribosyl transferase
MHGELKEIIHEEKQRLEHQRALFHTEPFAEVRGKAVLLVDDGLATGATTEAAVLAARKQGALRVVVAAPVASHDAVRRLNKVADEVVALHVDDDFDAVGRYYGVFTQTSDSEVLAALREARQER